MGRMKYLKKENLEDIEISEIDFDFYNEMEIPETDEDGEGWYDHEFIIDQNGSPDAEVIKIDRVIEQLQNMKDKGCNYMTMEYHCDHIGYMFAGFKISEASEEEVKTYKKKIEEKEILKREQEIKRLQEQLDKVKNAK
jgi:hypothetical protein